MVKRWIYGVLALGLAASPAVAQTPNLSAGPASTLPLPKYSGPYDPSRRRHGSS